MTTYIKRRQAAAPGRPLGAIDLKTCEHCSKEMPRKRIGVAARWEFPAEYRKRRYCDSACAGQAAAGRYKEDVLEAQGHYRARLIKPEGPCEKCGGTVNVDVHHEDENPLNNVLENLINLCRRCHYRHHNPVKVCGVAWCERPRRRNGLCEAHDQRQKRGIDMDMPFQQRRSS